MSNKKAITYIGLIIFFLFICFSWIVHKNVLSGFDFNMTVRLQDHIPRKLDQWFSLLSLIGNFEYVTIALIILLLLFRKILGGFLVFCAYGFFHLMELYGKTFVKHAPPPHFLLRTNLPFNFPQFYVSTENSYPSGHSARALFLTTIIFLFIWKSKKISEKRKMIIIILLIFYDITMTISRIYLGEHWTSDVIGGVLAGLGLALISGSILL